MPRFSIDQVGPDIDLDKEEVYLDDGTRLTEELAERMGAEAAARAQAGRGRPSISGSGCG